MLPENLLFEALDRIHEPLFVLSADLKCVFFNQAFAKFLGSSLGGQRDLAVGDFWPEIEQVSFGSSEIFAKFMFGDGNLGKVKLSINQLSDRCLLFIVIGSAFKDSTADFFHSQRLETLGMLAGGVAHDFNNVLAGIMGHTTYLKTILPGSGSHLESLLAIEEGGLKASALVKEILSFSKLDIEAKPVLVDLGQLVCKTCRLLRGGISPKYNLDFDIPDHEMYVLGVEGRLAQVLVNLVMNSRDAVEADGHIDIRLGHCGNLNSSEIELVNLDPDQEWIFLEVKDDGAGIPESILSKVMEPYFSTKKEKGTGLGLATVDAIIQDLGGKIELRSEEGSGTTVITYLPAVDKKTGNLLNKAEAGDEYQLQTGTESVLVVDDEDPVRNVLSVSLLHLGYQVEIASSGQEALEKFSAKPQGYDLIILDMLMPVYSGEEVFFKLQEIDKEVKVLVISGYTSETSVKRILDNGGLGFIQKPFTIEQLSQKVRSCLDLDA